MKQRVRNQLEAFDVLEKCGQYRQSKDELSSHCDYSSFDCLFGLRELFNGELLALRQNEFAEDFLCVVSNITLMILFVIPIPFV